MKEMQQFLCAGSWDSWLNDEDDGFFELRIDNAGVITGKHVLPDDSELHVTGRCEHTPHRITIVETREGVEFEFSGQIVPKGSGRHKTKNGRRRRGGRGQFDDEVWTGVRTT